MSEFTAISLERHAKKAWRDVTDYAFAASEALIPLVGAEFSKAVPAMPIGFVEQEGAYQLVAIMSLHPGKNLYVAPNGSWLARYIPAGLRAYPFKLALQENTDSLILCINESSGLVMDKKEGGNAFFDDNSEPTEKIKEIHKLLIEIEASRTATQRAVDGLADAGLITPWALNIRRGEEVTPVEGLFQFDEAALSQLDDDEFLTLRKSGGLPVGYAQLLSMDRLVVLERLDEMQDQLLSQTEDNSNATDLADFALSQAEDTLNFD